MDGNSSTSTPLTIGAYLHGQAGGYPITDDAIRAILFDYSGSDDVDAVIGEYPIRDRDILTAKVLLWCADVLPYTTAYVEDVNGVWKHKQGAVTMKDADREALRRRARMLLGKWGVDYSRSSIKVSSMGIKII